MTHKISFLFLGLVIALLYWTAQSMVLREWQIEGGDKLARAKTEKILQQTAGDNLLWLNLNALRVNLQSLPTVANAQLYRRLPNTLNVRLSKFYPVAAWASGGLVDARGVRYPGEVDKWLPIFQGPERRVARMLDFYESAKQILTPAVINQLHVDEDGESRVFLEGGLVLHLGRESRLLRLRRYARYAPLLRQKFARLNTVDLRYEKGFSVSSGGDES